MKYFTLNELSYSDTAKSKGINNTPGVEEVNNLTALVTHVLDPLREWYGKPIKINSGYRCEKLNKAVGGVVSSQHLKGEAADIDTNSNVENRKLFNYIKTNLVFDQLLWEHNGAWIHVSYKRNGKNRRQVLNIG